MILEVYHTSVTLQHYSKQLFLNMVDNSYCIIDAESWRSRYSYAGTAELMINFTQLLVSFQHFDSSLWCFVRSQGMVNEMNTVLPIPVTSPYKDNLLYLTAWQTLPVFLCSASFSLYRKLLACSIQYSWPDLRAAPSILLFSLRQWLSAWTLQGPDKCSCFKVTYLSELTLKQHIHFRKGICVESYSLFQ
jgi:hypothetical protein